MPLSNYQYAFNGLTMGSGTVYTVEQCDGLLDLPDIRAHGQERTDGDGDFSGEDLLASRVVRLQIALNDSPSSIESDLRALATAFARIRDPANIKPFSFLRPGLPVLRLNCRPRRKAFPSVFDVPHGLARGAVELVGDDPLLYDDTETVTNISPHSSAVLNNVGNAVSYPTLVWTSNTVVGGSGDPIRFINQTTNQTLTFGITGNLIGTYTFDMLQKVAKDPNNANADYAIAFLSLWWGLVPGNNTIYCGPGTSLAVHWRSARDSV